jgi:hypothetical protein
MKVEPALFPDSAGTNIFFFEPADHVFMIREIRSPLIVTILNKRIACRNFPNYLGLLSVNI